MKWYIALSKALITELSGGPGGAEAGFEEEKYLGFDGGRGEPTCHAGTHRGEHMA